MFIISEKSPFGLDISDYALRLVHAEKKYGKLIITASNETALPDGAIVDGEIKKPDIVSAAIHKCVKTAKGKKIASTQLITALPETKTFIKVLHIRCSDEDEIPSLLAKELTKHIPYPIEEIYFDWEIVGGFSAEKTNTVLAGVAPIKTVESYVSVIKNASLIPKSLQIEAVPIIASILPKNRDRQEHARNDGIIIDLGATRTSLILHENNIPVLTMSLPISGNDITKKISNKLNLDAKQAEKAKILCGLDPEKCSGALKTILTNNINQLMEKIETIISFYQEQNKKKNTLKEIILTGGGARLLHIDKILYERFKLPVRIGDSLQNIARVEKPASIDKNKITSFSTAIGLAIKVYE